MMSLSAQKHLQLTVEKISLQMEAERIFQFCIFWIPMLKSQSLLPYELSVVKMSVCRSP